MPTEIWTWLQLTPEGPFPADLGLIAEARRLGGETGGGRVTVLAAGADPANCLPQLADYGADAVFHLVPPAPSSHQGELTGRAVRGLLTRHQPDVMLFGHRPDTADLAARLGAGLDWPVITRAVDAHPDVDGRIRAVRPIHNGYLHESVETVAAGTVLITFLPDGLPDPRPFATIPCRVQLIDQTPDPPDSAIRVVALVEADPATLALEETDIVVAAGRGVGTAEDLAVIERLARSLGGLVGGTRPVIDAHLLPFERQIGQTGKTVTPLLIINCGISGANEYTAGMEKSQRVVAINSDPRARMFRFADLGIVGDARAILPLLIERLEKITAERE